jgi:hypothetical protein
MHASRSVFGDIAIGANCSNDAGACMVFLIVSIAIDCNESRGQNDITRAECV